MQDVLADTVPFNSLFTAVVKLDKNLQITSVSPLIGRYAPEIRCGQKFADAFELVRPRNLASSNLKQKLEMIFLLLARESRYPIRGQMVAAGEGGYVLLGSPWLSRMTDDQIHQYELKDFPLHDAQLDWLFMLSAEKQQVRDLQRLSRDLELAKAEAESAIESKSNFFAVMSHEMRTPLNAIIGSINLMPRDTMNEGQTRLLDISVSAAQQLLSVINDVLDYSKMEAGKLEMEYGQFNLTNVVEDVIAIVNPHAEEKNLSLTAIGDDILSSHVIGDNGKIKQILLNLLTNAIKFTEKGSVTLRVKEQRRDNSKVLIRFSIIDTGVGIAEADKERLFQQFWTSSIEQGFHGRGTGLGLSIAKRMSQLMHGEIGCESKLGNGSTFWVEIPFELVDVETAKQVQAAKHREPPTELLQGKRVLIAEDNQANQIIAKLSLQKLGIVADIANNGLEVLKALESAPYDAILMDIGMPVMNGIEATRKIRQDLGMTEIPIIACTAHSLAATSDSLDDPGFSGYVAKPIDRIDLINVLVELIGEKNQARNQSVPDIGTSKLAMTDAVELISESDFTRLQNDIGVENMQAAIKALIMELQSRSKSIKAAHTSRNLNNLAEEAHALKSSALSFGANKLAAAVKQLEKLAAEENTEAYELVESVMSITDETRIAYLQK